LRLTNSSTDVRSDVARKTSDANVHATSDAGRIANTTTYDVTPAGTDARTGAIAEGSPLHTNPTFTYFVPSVPPLHKGVFKQQPY